MKRNRRPVIVALSALLLVLCMLCLGACRKQVQNSDEELPPDDGELVTVTGIDGYKIIRPDNASTSVRTETGLFYSALKEFFPGLIVDVDYTKEPKPVVNDDYEILIGATNRKESEDAKAFGNAQAGDKWYYLGVHGNKIVITGADDEGVLAAIRYFTKYYAKAKEDGAVEMPKQVCRAYNQYEPRVVSTNAQDVFVISADVGAVPYLADRTGQRDMADVIQQALNDVAAIGGGVVYLPAGTYRLTKQIKVPSYVSLRGDYVDPDKGDMSTGTVLVLDGEGTHKNYSSVLISETSAIEGLTFYYDKQNVKSPVEYSPTVELSGSMITIKDCNFVNSWYAIYGGARAKGMMTLENVKGTALWRGMDNDQSADICVTTDLYFSPTYWAGAGAAFGAPKEEDIRRVMAQNESIGFTLGDCDRDTYENVLLDGFATGVYNREPTRGGVCGSWYNVNIINAKIGMNMYGISGAYGLLLTNCNIEADNAAICNDNSAMEDKRNCIVYLLGCTVKGSVSSGVKTMDIEGMDMDTSYTPISNRPTITKTTLYDVSKYGADRTGKEDVSTALQKALDDAASAGGGIVYLPAGLYRLEQPIEVGANTVLMGAFQAPQKGSDAFKGTVILATWGRMGDASSQASITVTGNNSGVADLTVYYPENGVSLTQTIDQSPVEYSYFIRCKGRANFVSELCMIAVSRGVHFDGANSFIADRISMTVYDTGIHATESVGGVISRIHTNGTYHNIGAKASSVLGADWMNDSSRVYELIDTHLRPRMTLIKIEDCEGIQIRHAFHYGAKTFLEATRSEIFMINCESGHIDKGKSLELGKKCNIRSVNFIRENPSEYISEEERSNTLRLYLFDCAFVPAVHVIR